MTRSELVAALIEHEVVLAQSRSGALRHMTMGESMTDEVSEAILADPDVTTDARYSSWLFADPLRVEVYAGLGIPEPDEPPPAA